MFGNIPSHVGLVVGYVSMNHAIMKHNHIRTPFISDPVHRGDRSTGSTSQSVLVAGVRPINYVQHQRGLASHHGHSCVTLQDRGPAAGIKRCESNYRFMLTSRLHKAEPEHRCRCASQKTEQRALREFYLLDNSKSTQKPN